MNKITIGLLVAILIGVFVIGFQLRSPKSFGGTTNYDSLELDGTLIVDGASTLTGAATFSGAVSVTGQVTAAGVVNTSGTSIGSGTNFTGATCGTATWNPGSLPVDETTSTGVTVTGATATSTQVYWAGINTS